MYNANEGLLVCERCGRKVTLNDERYIVSSYKYDRQLQDELKASHLCAGCGERFKRVMHDFMKG